VSTAALLLLLFPGLLIVLLWLQHWQATASSMMQPDEARKLQASVEQRLQALKSLHAGDCSLRIRNANPDDVMTERCLPLVGAGAMDQLQGGARRLCRTRTPSASEVKAELARLQARVERVQRQVERIGEGPEPDSTNVLEWDISVDFDQELVKYEQKLADQKTSQWAVYKAALRLQCWVRRRNAQKLIEERYEALMLAEMNRAVTSIQSAYRGTTGRKRAVGILEARFERELNDKAMRCQCLWRQFTAKRRVQRLREAAAARCSQGIDLPE